MKYTSILLIILLQLPVKSAHAQAVASSSPHLSTVDSISPEVAKKMAIEDFLKFRPGYKLLNCKLFFCRKGEISTNTYQSMQKDSTWQRLKNNTLPGDVFFFDDIDVMNGEKKIHLTKKVFCIK